MRKLSAATILSGAIGLAMAMPVLADGTPAAATPATTATTAMKPALEKCYGINAAAKNDCAAGVHSCAGQATAARDPKSFVLLPAGACGKIQGGNLKAM
jgi:uncharacterized membrane protein